MPDEKPVIPFDIRIISQAIERAITEIEVVSEGLRKQIAAKFSVAGRTLTEIQIEKQSVILNSLSVASRILRPVLTMVRTGVTQKLFERIEGLKSEIGLLNNDIQQAVGGDRPIPHNFGVPTSQLGFGASSRPFSITQQPPPLSVVPGGTGVSFNVPNVLGFAAAGSQQALDSATSSRPSSRPTGSSQAFTTSVRPIVGGGGGTHFGNAAEEAILEAALGGPEPSGAQQLSSGAASAGSCNLCSGSHDSGESCSPGTVIIAPSRSDDIQFAGGACYIPANDSDSGPDGFTGTVTIWHDPVSQFCYSLPSTSSPRRPSDIAVGNGNTVDAALAQAQCTCGPLSRAPQPEAATGPSSDLGSFLSTAASQCQSSTYNDVNNLPLGSGLVTPEILGQKVTPDSGGILASIAEAVGVGERETFIAKLISGFYEGVVADGTQTAEEFAEAVGCLDPATLKTFAVRAGIGFLGQWFVPPLLELDTPFRYAQNRVCQFQFPDQNQAVDAFLTGDIDERTLEAWVNINGYCSDPYGKIVQSRRTKPIPIELSTMLFRGLISPSEYQKGMRQLGYLDTSQVDALHEVRKPLPPLSELIRYMVRDVADESIVSQFGLDDDFSAKFAGDVKRWSDSQGVDPKIMQASWRAHWSIPGPDQLFEMLHRLRPGVVSSDVQVTAETVRTALRQQDIAPFWVDRLTAVSFRPLTRVDVRRAFDIGAIDRPAVKKSYLDLGYADENAETLTKFAETVKNGRVFNHLAVRLYKSEVVTWAESMSRLDEAGFPVLLATEALELASRAMRNNTAMKLFRSDCITKDEAVSRMDAMSITADIYSPWIADAVACKTNNRSLPRYKKCLISRETATTELTDAGWPDAKITAELDAIDSELEAAKKGKCIDGLKKRFELGELALVRFEQKLHELGIEQQCVAAIVAGAECELDAIGKMPSTSMLCTWLEAGTITSEEMLSRLRTIGWSEDDSLRILTDCITGINAKLLKEARRTAEQAAKQAEKDRKERERIEKGIVSDATKRARRLEIARKAGERREKLIASAAAKLSQETGSSLVESISQIKSIQRKIRTDFDLTIDQSIQAIVSGIEASKKLEGVSPLDRIIEFAQAFAVLDFDIFSSNGASSGK